MILLCFVAFYFREHRKLISITGMRQIHSTRNTVEMNDKKKLTEKTVHITREMSSQFVVSQQYFLFWLLF